MKDFELGFCSLWRYCNVTPGDKVPYPNNWQNTPLTLQQVTSSNIGLQLGEHSNGVCAIDFDGVEAVDYWNENFPGHEIDKINTVMWSSGKPFRLQAAFTVPHVYWDVLKRKVVSKLEFRWGGQSVLPPSKLNDGRQYFWIQKPSMQQIQEIPEDVLAHWLNLIYQDITKYDNTIVHEFVAQDVDEEFVNHLLEKISYKVGNLRGDYDVWRTIAWATCSAVGITSAKMLMQYYFPDKTNKEMKTLTSWKTGIGPKLGTLIKLAGISATERRVLELEMKLRNMK
tara:strand:- start:1850 stop:2698 length:849 start_codon:yes stop_codon:yes gene_type:complete